MRKIGTCSLCGGPVVVPTMWMGVQPPTPECQRCGATPKAAHGPVIDMEAPRSAQRAANNLAEIFREMLQHSRE